jgi:hypothetical protein
MHVGTQIYVPTKGKGPVYKSRGFSRCSDIVGNYPNANGLSIEHFYLSQVGTISGKELAFPIYEWIDYPYDNQPGYPTIGAGSPPHDNTFYATSVAASTSPTRPAVSVPNMIWELIPKKLHEAGGRHAGGEGQRRAHSKKSKGDNSIAEFNFGWDQLFRDVARIFKFQEDLDKRIQELNRLYSRGGLTRKRVVWTATSAPAVTAGLVVQTFNATVRVTRTATTSYKKWVSIRWSYPTGTPIPSDTERIAKARLLIHGWSNAPARVWEALPWSWMIDYFANIGDFLNANGNELGLIPTNICVMDETRTVSQDTLEFVESGFTAVPARSEYISKQRILGSIGLSAHVPFLSAQQVTTLSGIARTYGAI